MWLMFGFLFSISSPAQFANCLNHCQMVRLADTNEFSLHCNCSKTLPRGEKDWLAQKGSPHRAEYLRQKFIGLDLSNYPEVVENQCRQKVQLEAPSVVRKKMDLAKLPLCECVSTIMQIQKEKSCRKTPAGEELCNFAANGDKVKSSFEYPNLYSYQVCMMRSETYERPSRCPASPCKAELPTCSEGESLFNVADPESCCPVFVCKKN